ncbi:non-oxidative hydroxyarylic acid decarboxylases subunit D [Serratia sp. L9]|uniref:non-oxidative hydroxyarylic acid decarboxylases subunit D n=1 Tax=Serratia sp. L9 TaxID=3423946 RepID=UPI003D679359
MNQYPEKCPRCESAGPEALSHSPVAGAWTVFHCPTCFFTWRSTEPDFITDPAKYPPTLNLPRQRWRILGSCQRSLNVNAASPSFGERRRYPLLYPELFAISGSKLAVCFK